VPIKLSYYVLWTCPWVPVTTEWRVLTLRMEERPPICRVAANILNKQSRTADKGWSSSLGFGRGANNSSLLKRMLLRNIHRQSTAHTTYAAALKTTHHPSKKTRCRKPYAATQHLMLLMMGVCTRNMSS